MPDIIDLTESPEIIVVSDGDDPHPPPSIKPRKLRRKKNRDDKDHSRPDKPKDVDNQRRRAAPASPPTSPPLFRIDLVPDPLATQLVPVPVLLEPLAAGALVLPAHITLVNDSDPASFPDARPESPMSDASFIDVIDDLDTRRFQRYYEEEKRGIVCHQCGDMGHIARHCPIVMCLTCGAKNDHPTGMCPASKVCFNCNEKGHLSKDCSKRRVRVGLRECDRCGSTIHYQNNCPSLWREYKYFRQSDRDLILRGRAAKRDQPFEASGGGFIAWDPWCYNCAACGHLGDDCPQGGRKDNDTSRDPTAFGRFTAMAGPFASGTAQELGYGELRARSRSPKPHHGNLHGRRPGRDGREQAKRRAAEAEREAERQHGDDDDDWFSRQRQMDRPAPRTGNSLRFGPRYRGGYQ